MASFHLLAIFLISAAVISYEILLVRFLEFTQFTELSATIISLALLGFGASGLYAHALQKKLSFKSSKKKIITFKACVFSPLSILVLFLIQKISLNPLAIFVDTREYLKLVLQFFLLSLPFFFRFDMHCTALKSFLKDQFISFTLQTFSGQVSAASWQSFP